MRTLVVLMWMSVALAMGSPTAHAASLKLAEALLEAEIDIPLLRMSGVGQIGDPSKSLGSRFVLVYLLEFIVDSTSSVVFCVNHQTKPQ